MIYYISVRTSYYHLHDLRTPGHLAVVVEDGVVAEAGVVDGVVEEEVDGVVAEEVDVGRDPCARVTTCECVGADLVADPGTRPLRRLPWL